MRHLRNQIVLFFCLFTLINYSQDLISVHNSGNFQLIQKLSFYDINIKGSPFIYEDFVTGQIVFESGKNITGDFRMDLHTHKIQTKNNDGKIFEISINNTFELIISGKKYSFHELDLAETNNFIILTEKEVQLLEILLNKKGPVSKDDILSLVWQYSSETDTHTVETHIYRLRKKISEKFFDEMFILNNKEGYYL